MGTFRGRGRPPSGRAGPHPAGSVPAPAGISACFTPCLAQAVRHGPRLPDPPLHRRFTTGAALAPQMRWLACQRGVGTATAPSRHGISAASPAPSCPLHHANSSRGLITPTHLAPYLKDAAQQRHTRLHLRASADHGRRQGDETGVCRVHDAPGRLHAQYAPARRLRRPAARTQRGYCDTGFAQRLTCRLASSCCRERSASSRPYTIRFSSRCMARAADSFSITI